MPRPAAILTAFALLLATGVAHGLRSERWSPSPALEEAVTRVPDVPRAFGDWQGEDVEGDAESFDQTGARAWWVRTYTNRRDGSRVQAILMCGRPGRMSVHTPEVCYSGAGYEMLADPTAAVIRDEAAGALGEFRTARFARPGGQTGALQLYWAWGDGGTWQAPASPRWEFRGRPFLCKLYVTRELNGSEPAGDANTGPAADFLRDLLPELRRTLAPTDATKSPGHEG